MSTPPVSVRTVVRDAVVAMLELRKGSEPRVPQYAISKKYLYQPTEKSNTYCVIVGDESPDSSRNMTSERWSLTLKIICWANDANDPHAMIDAMIEDVQDAMRLVRSTLHGVVSDILPGEISPDERTVEALPWGQAVRTWTMSHERS